MLSDQQIKSLVRIQPDQNDAEEVNVATLDLSHQELRKLKQIEVAGLNVKRVNASYNYFKDYNDLNIKEINEGLAVPFEYLDISFNFFTKLDQSAEASHILKYLKYLNISANRIQSLDFTNLTVNNLQTLIINNNKLQYFISCPNSLKILSINDNILNTLAFSGGHKLNALSAVNNKITKIQFELPQLIILDLQTNMIQDLQMLKSSILKSKQIMSINLRENPISKFKNYKVIVLQSCDNITQIDQIIINPHIREGFKMLKSEQKLNQMLDDINNKYEQKLMEKQRIKQQLIKKIRQKQKIIENRFENDLQQQKKQLEMLQNQAKSILAQKQYGITNQTKDFEKLVKNIRHDQQEQLNQQDTIKRKHFDQYLQYLRKRAQKQPQKPKIRDIKSQPSSKMAQSIASIESSPQYQNFKLFDPRCIEIVFNGYDVEL